MSVRDADAYPRHDREIPSFLSDLGLDGIVDIHVHALPDRLQQAVWRFFDGLDDPPWPIHYRLDASALLDRLDRLGVVSHTALAYAHRPGMLEWLNGYTLDLADRMPAVIPTFTIFPEEGVGQQTRTAIARGGAVVKVHLQVGRFHATDPRLDEAWEQIAAAGLPVVLHATAVYGVDGGEEYCGIPAVRALLSRHPDLRIVLAHLGRPDHEAALRLAEEDPRLHFDQAMTLLDGDFGHPWSDQVLSRVRALAPRLCFGSDYPSMPHDYATAIRSLAKLQLDDDQLRAVLAENARQLLSSVSR